MTSPENIDATPSAQSHGISILIVDDDEDVCIFLSTMLSNHGYNAVSVSDPTKALKTIKTKRPQIVLLDLVMPKKSGIELLDDIRQFDSDLCVIIISAYPSFDNAVASFKGKVFDFVAKPFRTEDLLDILDKAVVHHKLASNLHERAMRRIAEGVRRLRVNKNFSMRQLAARSGLSTSLIHQVEHQSISPSLATIARLATALDVPLSYFFDDL